jgi:hypothetical protein
VWAPIYGEMSGNFTVPFMVMLFHSAGHINPTYATFFGPLITNVVWDTPDGQPPVMQGDPSGLVMFTGHFTVDLSKADGSGVSGLDVPKRGWFQVRAQTRTYFDNGDSTDTFLHVPFYSMLDPSAPETFLLQGGPITAAWCGAGSARDTPADAVGLYQVSEVNTYLPILAPITAPIAAALPHLFGYGTQALPQGTGMARFDMDLHNGIAGTLIQSASGPSRDGVFLASPFDPAILGMGTHKVAMIWQQDTGDGIPGQVAAQEQATSLLVVSVTVGAAAPAQAPTLASLSPAQGVQGTTVPVTLTGSRFIAGATVNVSGAGVVATNVVVTSPTSISANLVINSSAAVGARAVFVATANGTSGTQNFTVTASAPVESWSNWLLQHGSISGNLRACPDTSGVGCVGVMKQ